MFKLLTQFRGLYIGIATVLISQAAAADAALLQVSPEQKARVLHLVAERFGADVHEVSFTMFAYDQSGYEVVQNFIPGVSVHGVNFLMKNGTPVHCSWRDSSRSRTTTVSRCEIKLNSKVTY